MRKQKILIVEDDVKIAKLLRDYLEHEDYEVSILSRGETVIYEVHHSHPDAILLDLMLPGKDGLTICKEIRSFSKMPILIISAKIHEIDRLVGLELGADDYICKPFSPREVVARVKAVMRRINPEPAEGTLMAGPITIKPESHTVTIMGATVHLTPDEFELLKILMSDPDFVFTRSDLVSKIQGYAFDGYDRTIDSHIKNLRKKISERLPGRDIIESVYGIGYKFRPPHSEQ